LTTRPDTAHNTGPIGPVSFSAGLLLLFAAPLMRGGNRQVALIVLEALALAFLLSVWLRALLAAGYRPLSVTRIAPRTLLLALLLLSPAWLALVYLLPVPASFWSDTPGRGIYAQLLQGTAIPLADWLPLSLARDATIASLLVGLPLVAAFLAGYWARLPQLRLLFWLMVAMAFAQVVLGLLQIAGGPRSELYFAIEAGGRPIGTFANPNHFANFLAMTLAVYIWLGWQRLLQPRSRRTDGAAARLASRHFKTLWIAGGVLLVLGILMSRSRGAALTGLPVGILALGVALSSGGRSHGWRYTLALAVGVVAGAVALVGLGAVLSRFELGGMADSAAVRGLLASTTWDGAMAFWPWGAGWGTYTAVYPRFQPLGLGGMAYEAHHDYAQMLMEGGIFAVVLAAAFLWLAGSRAALLVKAAFRDSGLSQEKMAAALCGLGLLGFLLHSFVEFNMHIPANAIVAALLAGAFLRPLDRNGARP
jgi:hypothetical protein